MTNDTWGISGPTFLALYSALIVVVLVVGLRERRRLARPDHPTTPRDWGELPQEVAYLHGGADLAVYSALSALHQAGAVQPAGKGMVQAVGRPAPDASPLERAIHATAAVPVAPRRLAFHSAVASALTTIRARLVADGLLLTRERREAVRRVGFWMLAVVLLGLARIVAGVANARSVGFLIVLVLLAGVISVVWLARAPERTAAAAPLLADLRTRYDTLNPAMRPDWTAGGARAAAVGVAVFGVGAVWASAPAFADELEMQKAAALGGSSGGGYTGYGGDSGSASSCGGGGGGCGGGGGGCGGGGGGGCGG
ncbi:TIGR04222 domain-containing membrane protein [Pseudonocardia oroxyli]|uniref:TIGR04222 domain-containing membrane protein n=1 Tax=Pseudonocardia oroxyli TaxID=366584 RepID=UPI0015A35817|nr:TIGR04222 domain-containing membrane protein [Pseudonocardia oroxyli]